MSHISDIKLIITDTTIDLSEKAEKDVPTSVLERAHSCHDLLVTLGVPVLTKDTRYTSSDPFPDFTDTFTLAMPFDSREELRMMGDAPLPHVSRQWDGIHVSSFTWEEQVISIAMF
ncbi:hypothetical protein Scep_025624 [Stephania cephalantha]|uniref:Uncharacterized protein n=1 Tax=Stephania cephalantha TaxID=152367 RepID=A0AAP0HSL4_9MAGN